MSEIRFPPVYIMDHLTFCPLRSHIMAVSVICLLTYAYRSVDIMKESSLADSALV
jgi:hypothetical protein